MTRTFTAVYEKRGDWWVAWTEELPGANAQERTLDEARQSLLEVIPLILDARRDADQADPTVQRVREELTIAV